MNSAKYDFLFATPTFSSGIARVLDLYGVYDFYNTSGSEYEADFKALRSDWCAVGQNLSEAMKQYESSTPMKTDVHEAELYSQADQMSFFA